MPEELKKKFILGSFWTTGQQVILIVIGIVQLAITSRLLMPLDFGIYAVAVFFSTLGHVAFSMGFSAALIRKRENIEQYLDTIWTASICISSIFSIIIIVLIPSICKWYFHNIDAIWPSIIIMLNCIFSASSNPGLNIYLKEINLKRIFYWNVSAKVFSFILVVIFVCILESYWGLIIALLSESLFRLVSSYLLHPYRPRFSFSWKQFKDLYSFSGWIQLKNITSWLAGNIDTAIVGNVLGSAKLGFYNRAQTVSAYPRSFIGSVIDSVAYPIYAKVNNDINQAQSVFNKIQDCIIAIIGMIALIFSLYSKQIILLVLGPQWTSMVPPFQILAIAYLFQTLFLSFIPILRAYGYTKQEFFIYAIQILVLIFFLYPLVVKWDLLGAGIAVSLNVCILFPIMIFYVYKKTMIKMNHYITSIIISILCIIIVVYIMNLIPFPWKFPLSWIIDMFLSLILFMLLHILIWIIFKKGFGYLLFDLKNIL